MAELAEAPPATALVDDDGTGSWTPAEIQECAALCDAASADDQRWALGDWLAARVPVGPVRGQKTGGHQRLAELAACVDWSVVHLRAVRDTAHAWPSVTRVSCAGFHVHAAFRDGGSESAGWRRAQLLAMDRGPRGRVTEASLRAWRDEHRQRRDTRGRSIVLVPEVADVLERIDGLVDDVDQLIRADAWPKLWGGVRAQLDSLSGEVERIAVALAQRDA